MGVNTHRAARPSGQSSLLCPRSSLGGRSPSSPNVSNNPLPASDPANIYAPLVRGCLLYASDAADDM
eukprot:1600558-Alexandrium_andersonii.AAC.2